MKKFVLLLVVFTIAVFLAFEAVALFENFGMLDYSYKGFPLKYSESWGPCPPSMVCHNENPQALAGNIAIAFLIAIPLAYFVLKGKRCRKNA